MDPVVSPASPAPSSTPVTPAPAVPVPVTDGAHATEIALGGAPPLGVKDSDTDVSGASTSTLITDTDTHAASASVDTDAAAASAPPSGCQDAAPLLLVLFALGLVAVLRHIFLLFYPRKSEATSLAEQVRLSGVLNRLEDRLRDLESSSGPTQKEIASIRARQDSFAAEKDMLSARVASMSETILSNGAANSSANAALGARLKAAEAGLGSILASIKSLDDAEAVLRAHVAQLASRQGVLDEGVLRLNDKISTLFDPDGLTLGDLDRRLRAVEPKIRVVRKRPAKKA